MKMEATAPGFFLHLCVIIVFQVHDSSARKEQKFDNNINLCFSEIGCFSKRTGPFNWTSVQPRTPKEIGTKFRLYKNQENQDLDYLSSGSRNTSLLDNVTALTVVVHGLGESSKSKWIVRLQNLLLQEGKAVIVVDWSSGSKKIHVMNFLERNAREVYLQAVVNTEIVGRQLARLLDLLREERGLEMDNVHLIGFSLGAHVVGFAGKALISDQPEQLIGRITGLDPAGPVWNEHSDLMHLSKNDARYVDIIHTSAGNNVLVGHFGIEEAIGHVDFYPNGGKEQPGCSKIPTKVSCKHKRAHELYLESMTSEEATPPCQFLSYPASSYKQFKQMKNLTCTEDTCALMGHFSNLRNSSGTYYSYTNSHSPYCYTLKTVASARSSNGATGKLLLTGPFIIMSGFIPAVWAFKSLIY